MMAPQAAQAQYQQTTWHLELARAWAAVIRVEDQQARIALTRFLAIVAESAGVPIRPSLHYGRPAPGTVPLVQQRGSGPGGWR